MSEKLPEYRSHDFYSAIGKRGGRKRVEKHGVEAMRAIGKKGGQRTKELNAKGKLYEQQQNEDSRDSVVPAAD